LNLFFEILFIVLFWLADLYLFALSIDFFFGFPNLDFDSLVLFILFALEVDENFLFSLSFFFIYLDFPTFQTLFFFVCIINIHCFRIQKIKANATFNRKAFFFIFLIFFINFRAKIIIVYNGIIIFPFCQNCTFRKMAQR
jgi:hypothetical protein